MIYNQEGEPSRNTNMPIVLTVVQTISWISIGVRIGRWQMWNQFF